MDEAEIRARLRQWIVSHAKANPTAARLDDQTPLLDTGLLSSLDIVEFVLYVEEIRGEEVDTDDIEPEEEVVALPVEGVEVTAFDADGLASQALTDALLLRIEEHEAGRPLDLPPGASIGRRARCRYAHRR